MRTATVSNSLTGSALACSYHALGALYSRRGQLKKSAEVIKRGAKLESDQPEVQYRAAVASFLAYDFVSAGEFIEGAMRQSPQRQGRYYNLKGFLLLLEQKYDTAEVIFRQAVSVNKDDLAVRVGMGHLAIVKKKYPEAERMFKAYLETNPKYVPSRGFRVETKMALLGMGWMLSNQNKYPSAIEYFDKILVRDPSDLFSLLGKGNAYNALGQFEKAEVSFKRVLELDPENQYGLAEMGLVKLNKGDAAGAERLFKRAMAKGDEKYTCPYEGLGLVYLKQGKQREAKEHFERAIQINPGIEFKKYNELAKIYIKQGNTAKAMSLLQKSIQNYPYDPEAKLLLARISRQ